MDERPIGIFDSGFGGLTVAKEIMSHLTNEKVIYFGDTARVPYGSKSKETVIKYSNQIIRFLLTKDVKAIVIACGTASSTALEAVRENFDIPIIGIVQPAALSAVKETINQRIGVIATEGTVRSQSYDEVIREHSKEIEVFSTACPLFVPLVEEGWVEDEVTTIIAKRYLSELLDKNIDALILGCTHYPLLTDTIGSIMGPKVKLINPANETALVLEDLLRNNDLMHPGQTPEHEFYVSDLANKFEAFAKIILKRSISPVKQIHIENY